MRWSVYEQLVWELGSRDTHGVVMLGCTPDVARFALPEGPLVLIVRHRADLPERTLQVATTALREHGASSADVVAAGDPGGAAALGSGPGIRRHAIDESGATWSEKPKAVPKTLGACFREVARNPGQLRLGASEFEAWLKERAAQAQTTIAAIQRYQAELAARKPIAVPILVALTCLVFGLEVMWGGAANTQNLIRMGAVVGDPPLSLQWWRPLAASFLHGGLLHLAGNMFVLWLIGGFLERLLGPWRLLALWTVSVAGGSFAALLFSDAKVMVGASGGGWGLMVAAGVMSIRGAGVIPEILAAPMRKSIRDVLVLNLMISFVPGIALSAHLGGGIAGGLIAVMRLATVGMQPPERAATRVGRDPLRGPVVAVGLISAALLLGSLGGAFANGTPWQSIVDGPWVDHATDIEGVTVSLPAGLGDGHQRPGRTEYGDLLSTSYLVTVKTQPMKPPALTTGKLFLAHHRLKKSQLDETLPPEFVRGETSEVETTMRFDLTERFTVGDGRAVRHTVSVPAGSVSVMVLEAANAAPIAKRVMAGPPDPT
ncbi:MAG: rhomboid family intramembrane serine protease [Proteobacteria bacterium]|nr:rhomboid family intramembrane serine protease [Pseudomonadota bacterium]